jgi:CHAD domain-containing protein
MCARKKSCSLYEKFVARMKKLWSDKRDLRDNLQSRLPKIAARYFEEGRRALKPGVSWDEMHRFRLQTKRFRYTLELFKPAYGPGLEKRIESLRKVQTYLGEINDAIVTAGMLSDMKDSEQAQKDLAARADSKTRKLRRFWSEEFAAEGAEEKWTKYLIQFAFRSSAKTRSQKPATAKTASS